MVPFSIAIRFPFQLLDALAKHPEEINFFDCFQSFIDNYTKKDVRHMCRSLAIFKEFLKEKKKYKAFVETIRPD